MIIFVSHFTNFGANIVFFFEAVVVESGSSQQPNHYNPEANTNLWNFQHQQTFKIWLKKIKKKLESETEPTLRLIRMRLAVSEGDVSFSSHCCLVSLLWLRVAFLGFRSSGFRIDGSCSPSPWSPSSATTPTSRWSSAVTCSFAVG